MQVDDIIYLPTYLGVKNLKIYVPSESNNNEIIGTCITNAYCLQLYLVISHGLDEIVSKGEHR